MFTKVWRYEKIVFQASSFYFRDVRNPRSQLFFIIKDFQVIRTCCRRLLVKMKFNEM